METNPLVVAVVVVPVVAFWVLVVAVLVGDEVTFTEELVVCGCVVVPIVLNMVGGP